MVSERACPARNGAARPLVAAVLMVKNEEARVDHVATVVPHVDRVAVLDTGSTDRTLTALRQVSSLVSSDVMNLLKSQR